MSNLTLDVFCLYSKIIIDINDYANYVFFFTVDDTLLVNSLEVVCVLIVFLVL